MGRLKRMAKAFLGRDREGRTVTVFPDDTWIVSYPRSGNTWARFLAGNLDPAEGEVGFRNIETRIPDIYDNTDRAMRRVPRPRTLKSHEYHHPGYRRVLYLVRDPRDVALSYYHYRIKMNRLPEGAPFETYLEDYLAGRLDRYGTWGEHVGGWLGARRDTADFLLVRYEDLLADTISVVGGMASFLGRPTDEDNVRRAIERSSAARMRKTENEWRQLSGSREDRSFVRKAVAGEWRTALDPAHAERIAEAWAPQMEMVAYV